MPISGKISPAPAGVALRAGGRAVKCARRRRTSPSVTGMRPLPEIAAEMFLSRHTISSQAMSIYRKLGAGSRSQAVTRSRELRLLEG